MKEHQAREIIFEEKVKKLLQDSNYINIVEQNIPGRSSSHGINSYGKLNLPTAFIFPLRIIFQYKYYAKNKVELMHVRDFGGIIADISETNYAIQGDMGNIITPVVILALLLFQEKLRSMPGRTIFLWYLWRE